MKRGFATLLYALGLALVALAFQAYCSKWPSGVWLVVFVGLTAGTGWGLRMGLVALKESGRLQVLCAEVAMGILTILLVLCGGGVLVSLARLCFRGHGVSPFM